MEKENCSSVTEFIFLGITSDLEVKVTLFAMLLVVYLINLLGNLGMIILIRMDPQLQTVLFPQPPLFLWPLLFHSNWAQDAGWPFGQEQTNPLLWLCPTILDCLYLCRFWVSPAGSDGLWSIQGHQQPLALCGQHVQRGVLPACGWGLPCGNVRCFDPHDISIPLMLLWVKWD